MSLSTSIAEHRDHRRKVRSAPQKERGFASRVGAFLKKDVPPSVLPISEEWRTEARSFGKKGLPYFLKALRDGDDVEQYSALIALRENGFEAWGHGYNADFEYHVTIDGEKQIIKPKWGDIDVLE